MTGLPNPVLSMYYESIKMFLISKGVCDATQALLSKEGFNAELEGAVLCIIEEEDLRQNKKAANKIKDWVTGTTMSIHPKGKTTYSIKNSAHFIENANHHAYCPIFKGDTRVVMMHVRPPKHDIPKEDLLNKLRLEAPYFLKAMFELEIPKPCSRLRIPVITTDEKAQVESQNGNQIKIFIEDECVECPGSHIDFSAFKSRFLDSLDDMETAKWRASRIKKELPPSLPQGHFTNNKYAIGNIRWKSDEPYNVPELKLAVDYDGSDRRLKFKNVETKEWVDGRSAKGMHKRSRGK